MGEVTLIAFMVPMLLVPVECLQLYITPEPVFNESCEAGTNSSVRPCYQLHQLNTTFFEGTEDFQSIVLNFLPGHHELLAPQSFMIQNRVSVKFLSVLDHEAEIVCYDGADFELQNIQMVTFISLHFNGCTLRYFQFRFQEISDSLSIEECYFSNVIFRRVLTIVGLHSNFVLAHIRDSIFQNCSEGVLWCHCNSFRCIHSAVQISNSTFFNNVANKGGALMSRGVDLKLTGCNFTGNRATDGGAIHTTTSFLIADDTVFENNFAKELGGAIYIFETKLPSTTSVLLGNGQDVTVLLSYCDFKHNKAESGGALHVHVAVIKHSTLLLTNNIFTFNKALHYGGAINCISDTDLEESPISIHKGYSEFNFALNGGFLHSSRCHVRLENTVIEYNTASSYGGAIYAENSNIDICSKCNVSYNTASDAGGGLFLDNYSHLKFHNCFPSQLSLISNTVPSLTGQGGAIYVKDGDCKEVTQKENECFLAGIDPTQTYLVLSGNRAAFGSVLFGGLLERCLPPQNSLHYFQSLDPEYSQGIDAFKQISKYEKGYLQISSSPMKVCLLDTMTSRLCNASFAISKMRGEAIKLKVAALDQDENFVPAIITARYRDLTAQLGKGESQRKISNKWETLEYHIFTTNNTAVLQIYPDGPCRSSNLSSIHIDIDIMPCHSGFEQDIDRCVCDRRLTTHLNITTCYLETLSVKRVGPIWFQFDDKRLKMHTHCPLDYCQVASHSISITQPDQQCAGSRSGVLCGACLSNHSAALGTSTCLKCSSPHDFVWLTLLFAVAGLALVALLMICNLTISVGTLQGFIFYVNVVSMSGLTSLSNCSVHPLLRVFVAWANLELGVRTCFFPGMNTYQKTWLQFCFPLYIWCLVMAIAVASHYSSRAMRLFGRNNIAILATLFLLSYSKILKTIVTALSFTDISVSEAGEVMAPVLTERVWTADANVEYRGREHAPLLVVSLLFLLALFLPYTLLLTLGQCVRTVTSRRRGLRWIHGTAFVSIMDAYHAPYNRRHRYWTGLLLLTRCLLALLFSTAHRESVLLVNMYAVAVVVTGLLVVKTFTTRIYRKPLASYLELAFLLNLEILSCTLCYLKARENGNDVICKVLSASIGVSFTLFVCILLFHAYLQLSKFQPVKQFREMLFLTFHSLKTSFPKSNNGSSESTTACVASLQPHTTTTVELREPLLDE